MGIDEKILPNFIDLFYLKKTVLLSDLVYFFKVPLLFAMLSWARLLLAFFAQLIIDLSVELL